MVIKVDENRANARPWETKNPPSHAIAALEGCKISDRCRRWRFIVSRIESAFEHLRGQVFDAHESVGRVSCVLLA